MSYKKEEYDAYLLTGRWLSLRSARLGIDNNRCRMCDKPATVVHHRRYPEILGTETVDDLTSLCDVCHKNYHFPPDVDEISLQTLRAAMQPGGVKCPCCLQHAQAYKRPFTSSMAAALIYIYRYFEQETVEEWVHVEDYLKSLPIGSAVRGDYGKLVHFQTLGGESLLIKKVGLREDGSERNGYWKISPSGKSFVLGMVRVPEWVRLYKNQVLECSGELIGIKSVLKNKFDYDELLKGTL